MKNKTLKLAVSAAAALALAGCGSLSRDIAADGSGAGRLVWPDPSNAIALHRGGTFPSLDNLHQVQAGLDKQQIIALIGAPHFDEGFFGVREWNYLFNIRAGNGAVAQCEYKILFDQDRIARSFHWNLASCADFAKAAMAGTETAAQTVARKETRNAAMEKTAARQPR